jgi:hypothetical protein
VNREITILHRPHSSSDMDPVSAAASIFCSLIPILRPLRPLKSNLRRRERDQSAQLVANKGVEALSRTVGYLTTLQAARIKILTGASGRSGSFGEIPKGRCLPLPRVRPCRPISEWAWEAEGSREWDGDAQVFNPSLSRRTRPQKDLQGLKSNPGS